MKIVVYICISRKSFGDINTHLVYSLINKYRLKMKIRDISDTTWTKTVNTLVIFLSSMDDRFSHNILIYRKRDYGIYRFSIRSSDQITSDINYEVMFYEHFLSHMQGLYSSKMFLKD